MEKFYLTPLSGSELLSWAIKGDLDTLAVQGWLIQGSYRVATANQSLDDYIYGLKVIEQYGYKFDNTDFYWIATTATLVEYFHHLPIKALEILNSIDTPNNLGNVDWSDLLFIGSPEVVGWFRHRGIMHPTLSPLSLRWIDLVEVITAISTGSINLNDSQWSWLSDRVNEPGNGYLRHLVELHEIGVNIYNFVPIINSCAIYVLSSVLNSSGYENRESFWRQWTSTLSSGTGSGICYNVHSMIVAYSLAAHALDFQNIISDFVEYLPPNLEQVLNVNYVPFNYQPVDYEFEQMYEKLSVESVKRFNWKYMMTWREVIRQMHDPEIIKKFIKIGMMSMAGQLVPIGKTPVYNITIMEMLMNRL